MSIKKILIGFGVFGFICFLAALVIPFFINVDKYRPMLVSKVNEEIQGKIELGHLNLSLWGRIHIGIDGLQLSDSFGNKIISVKEASFNVPLLSFLSGKPELRLELIQPDIEVLKLKSGELNVATLTKKKEKKELSESKTEEKSESSKDITLKDSKKTAPVEVPAIVMHARYTFLLKHAKLQYKDLITKDFYAVDDLNVNLKDVSPVGTMPFEISANLAVQAQKDAKLSGPLILKGKVKANSKDNIMDQAEVEASLKLNDMNIVYGDLFDKEKGTPLGVDFRVSIEKENFSLPELKLVIADVLLKADASGKVKDDQVDLNFKLESNQIDIAKLSALTPLVKKYNLNGLVELAAQAKGPLSKLDYSAHIALDKINLSHESLKQPVMLNGKLDVETNQIKELFASVTAKDFDLRLNGALQNFQAPRFKFKLSSEHLNVDGLLKEAEQIAQKRSENVKKQIETTEKSTLNNNSAIQSATAPLVDYNAMFEPMKKNPVLANAGGVIDFQIKNILATGISIQNTKGVLELSQLVLALKDFTMQIFGGSIEGAMSFDAKQSKPKVGTQLTINALQTQKMLESKLPFARNTIRGTIFSKLNIGGSGLNLPEITQGWHGSGTLNIQDAVFSTLDIGKKIKEQVINKIPDALRSKANISDQLLDWEGQYEKVDMKFSLANGVFNLSELTGKAHPKKGMDLKGKGITNLKDYSLDLNLELIDTYNLTGLEQYAKDSHYNKFVLSPKLGGTLFAPKFDWGATVQKLAENALKQQGKQALQRALGNVIPGAGGNNKDSKPDVKEVFKGLKGLFGK